MRDPDAKGAAYSVLYEVMKGLMRASPRARELFGGLALSCLPTTDREDINMGASQSQPNTCAQEQEEIITEHKGINL